MQRLRRFISALFFISLFSHFSYGQTDIYIQANSYFTDNSDLKNTQLGVEAGLALKKWDLAGVAHRSVVIDLDQISVTPKKRTFMGASIARRINLKLFGLRFPFLLGMSNVDFDDGGDTSDSYFTISPGAQICVGKYRTQVGLGYQYFYSANVDYDAFNSGSLSAFLRVKLF